MQLLTRVELISELISPTALIDPTGALCNSVKVMLVRRTSVTTATTYAHVLLNVYLYDQLIFSDTTFLDFFFHSRED